MPRLLVLFALLLLTAPAAAKRRPAVDSAAYLRAGVAQVVGEGLTTDVAWSRLVELCDTVGHRFSGSARLDRALDWAEAELNTDGLDAVRRQAVDVPKWVRGPASLAQLTPVELDLRVLALGGSVGTPEGGIEADLLVVSTFEELEAHGAAAAGRIVVWNAPWDGYGPTVQYRTKGASAASKAGALASLTRSVTPVSLSTPHTGNQRYAEGVTPIPTAAITVEDAERFARLQAAGITPRVRLNLEARDEGMVPSANIIGEIRGRELPEEIVLVGGHIDSWDVGEGAQDDGAGVVFAMEAMRLIARLPHRPRRTVRVVLFTNEENGLNGARAYAEDESPERHVAVLEADTGAGPSQGWRVDVPGGDGVEARQAEALAFLDPLRELLMPLGASGLRPAYSGADVRPVVRTGALGLGVDFDTTGYWPIHHTEADTIDKIDPATFRRNAASMAATALWLAEHPGPIPRWAPEEPKP